MTKNSKSNKRKSARGAAKSRGPRRRARNPRSGATGTTERGKLSGTAVTESFVPLFPAKTTKWLRYCDDFSLSSSLGVMTTYVYSANGLYDPNITGTGHQPMGFDTMMSYYEHYHVERCRWKAVFRNTGNDGGFCGARVDADVTPLSNYIQALENGRMVYDILDKTGTTYSWKQLQGEVNLLTLAGLTRTNFLADGNLRGTAAANPSEQTYLHFSLWNPLGSNAICDVSLTLEFLAVFTEPRPLTQSLTRVAEIEEKMSYVKLDSPPACCAACLKNSAAT